MADLLAPTTACHDRCLYRCRISRHYHQRTVSLSKYSSGTTTRRLGRRQVVPVLPLLRPRSHLTPNSHRTPEPRGLIGPSPSNRSSAGPRLTICGMSVRLFQPRAAGRSLADQLRSIRQLVVPQWEGSGDVLHHAWDLRTSISQPGEDGSKPCSISQRMAVRLRSDQ